MRTEEATNELRYLRDLIDTEGSEDVPRDSIASYLRTQGGALRRSGAPRGPAALGECGRKLEAAASVLERALGGPIKGALREAGAWVGAAFREALELEGAAAAEFRGHALEPFELRAAVPRLSQRSQALCARCGRGVWVDTRPPANGIELAGEALALGCTD